MGDLSKFHEKIFWGMDNAFVNLYLRGRIPSAGYDFGVSFDGKCSVVRFRVNDFATRDIDSPVAPGGIKKRLDEWAESGVQKVDRFLLEEDLTSSLKKGDNLELFVEFPDNANWIKKGFFYIPANNIKKYSVVNL